MAKDDFKDFLNALPEQGFEEAETEDLVGQIIRRELRNFWESRICIIAALSSVVFGFLMVRQMFEMAEVLGTSEFWTMLTNDRDWMTNDFFAAEQAFLEATPFREIGLSLILLCLFIFSLVTFLNEQKRCSKNELGKRENRSYLIPLFIVLLCFSSMTSYFVLKSKGDLLEEFSFSENEVTGFPKLTPTSVNQALSTPRPTALNFFLEVVAPMDGEVVTVSQIKVQGNTVPFSEVDVNETSLVADKYGRFSTVVGLQEGENYLTIAAGDETGSKEIERVVILQSQ